MDMVYSYPDVLSYSSLRHPSYPSYENVWKSEKSKQDKRARSGPKKTSDSCRDAKDSCPICQERQRRPLASYIKQKSREDRTKDASILEEEECDQEPTHASTGTSTGTGTTLMNKQPVAKTATLQ